MPDSTAPRPGPSRPPSPPSTFLHSPPPTGEAAHRPGSGALPGVCLPGARSVHPAHPQAAPMGAPCHVVLPRGSETFPATAFPSWSLVRGAHPSAACGVLGAVHAAVLALRTRRPLWGLTQACQAPRTEPALPEPRPPRPDCAPRRLPAPVRSGEPTAPDPLRRPRGPPQGPMPCSKRRVSCGGRGHLPRPWLGGSRSPRTFHGLSRLPSRRPSSLLRPSHSCCPPRLSTRGQILPVPRHPHTPFSNERHLAASPASPAVPDPSRSPPQTLASRGRPRAGGSASPGPTCSPNALPTSAGIAFLPARVSTS